MIERRLAAEGIIASIAGMKNKREATSMDKKKLMKILANKNNSNFKETLYFDITK
jgi:hypothetical protein